MGVVQTLGMEGYPLGGTEGEKVLRKMCVCGVHVLYPHPFHQPPPFFRQEPIKPVIAIGRSMFLGPNYPSPSAVRRGKEPGHPFCGHAASTPSYQDLRYVPKPGVIIARQMGGNIWQAWAKRLEAPER